jgi:hypothetical protein
LKNSTQSSPSTMQDQKNELCRKGSATNAV